MKVCEKTGDEQVRPESNVRFAREWERHRQRSHELHLHLYERIRRHLAEKRNGVILDAGCGEGSLASYLGDWGATNVTGIDVNNSLLEACKNKIHPPRRLLCCDLSFEIPLPRETFDAIVCSNVLMHINELDVFLALGNLVRVLKDDGVVVVVTTHPDWVRSNYLKSTSRNFPLTLHRKFGTWQRRIPQYFRDEEGMRILFEKTGLNIIEREEIPIRTGKGLDVRYLKEIGRPIFDLYKLGKKGAALSFEAS